MEDNGREINDKSMRKSQIRQIESILELLGKAQDSAIQEGGMIEESLGEDFVTVEIMESYCKQIYQTYEMIRQQQYFILTRHLCGTILRAFGGQRMPIPTVMLM